MGDSGGNIVNWLSAAICAISVISLAVAILKRPRLRMGRQLTLVLVLSSIFAAVGFFLIQYVGIARQSAIPNGSHEEHGLPAIRIRTPESLLAEELATLVKGRVLSTPPERMRVGDMRQFEVRIEQGFSDDIKKNLPAKAGLQIDTIDVGDFMRVKVTSPDGAFGIVPQTEADQFLKPAGGATWKYEMTALVSGSHHLAIDAIVRLKIRNTDEMNDVQVYTRDIIVDVNVGYTIKEFWNKYWQWIIATLLVPSLSALIVRWWKKRDDEEGKKPEPPKIVID
jgi:hypothetical protein